MDRPKPKNCGVVYVAWGRRYLETAAASARRITEYPVALVTNDPEFADPVFYQIIRRPLTDYHFYAKLEAFRHTPFDVTLYLDTEAKIIGDVSLGFRAADRYGLACVISPGGTFVWKDIEYVHYQGGVWFFRGQPVQFADQVASHAAEFPRSDEPAFSIALDELGINPYVLPVTFDLVAAGWIHPRPIRVWHGHQPIQTHLVSTWEYPWDLPAPKPAQSVQFPGMDTLTWLLAKQGSTTDKQCGHTYGPTYDAWFAALKNDPIHLLELGCNQYGGGDLLAFAAFFEQGTIWAVDNTFDKLLPTVRQHPRIRTLLADAYAESTPAKLDGRQLDIIIDDCDHAAFCQLRAIELYWPLLRPRGCYVVEDCTRQTAPTIAAKLREVSGSEPEIVDMADPPNPSDNILVKATKR